MSAATLTTAPDVERAVTDDAYYADVIATLTGPAVAAFKSAVDTAYTNRQRAGLTHEDAEILRFATRAFRTPAIRDVQIRARFGHSATVYFQRLNRLIDTEAALAAEPALVNRLRRIRDTNRTRRTATRPAERAAR